MKLQRVFCWLGLHLWEYMGTKQFIKTTTFHLVMREPIEEQVTKLEYQCSFCTKVKFERIS